ncbi:MAG: aminotransferase class V-fold PLP-dependent enzyme, partial [Candidatus Solibacter usitatus]|nr:aminotransferase class V-fold PLP-dependent enzyme [Candidatus Solibacter usitatus]
ADFQQKLTPRTRLVMVSGVNYSTGLLAPLKEISEACRANGTLLYIDGTQSLGALTFDCQSIQPDMYAVDAYKWMLSPNGAGFAYIPEKTRQWLQPSTYGWRSDRRWREVDALHHGAPELKSEAERYEGGMLPFACLYAMWESARMMLALGPENIEERVMQLADYARQHIRALGGELLSDQDANYTSQIVTSKWPGRDPAAIVAHLKSKNIVTTVRHGHLRVSPHFYNNEQDLDKFASEVNCAWQL